MVADRLLEGEHQGSLGMDATPFFTSTLGMTGQLAQSLTTADARSRWDSLVTVLFRGVIERTAPGRRNALRTYGSALLGANLPSVSV
jgi:hypothetical protein